MRNMKNNILKLASLLVVIFATNNVHATIINGTGDITPDVIFGSGNANGSWSGENINGIEVGLRGKLRYNLAGNPENTFNYDGDKTYTFDPNLSDAPTNRSIFNFEFAVNVDSSGSTGFSLDDFTYLFEFDIDPTAGTNFVSFDIIAFITNNSIGTNATANGAGIEDPGNYASLLSNNNVAQNSQNRGFGYTGGLDPQLNGMFTYNLSVLDLNGGILASSSIDIIVGDVPVDVSAPSVLSLMLTGLMVCGFTGWRRQKGQYHLIWR